MGRQPAAEPFRPDVLAPNDRARRAGVDGGAHDRRSSRAGTFSRSDGRFRFPEEPGLCAGRVQGTKADVTRLEPAAAPAYSVGRRPHHRVGVAAGRIPASILRARHIGFRSSRDQMPAQMTERRHMAMWRRPILGVCLAFAPVVEADAYKAYVSNEKGNTITVIDTTAWKVVETIKVGQRPRGIAFTKDQKYVLVAVGDDDTIQMIDSMSNKIVDTLPSGPDPELFVDDPTGKILYVANED